LQLSPPTEATPERGDQQATFFDALKVLAPEHVRFFVE